MDAVTARIKESLLADRVRVEAGVREGDAGTKLDIGWEANGIDGPSSGVNQELGIDGLPSAADQQKLKVPHSPADGLLPSVQDNRQLRRGVSARPPCYGDKVLKVHVVVARRPGVVQVGVDGVDTGIGHGKAKHPAIKGLPRVGIGKEPEDPEESKAVLWVLVDPQRGGDEIGCGCRGCKAHGALELPLASTRKGVIVVGSEKDGRQVGCRDGAARNLSVNSGKRGPFIGIQVVPESKRIWIVIDDCSLLLIEGIEPAAATPAVSLGLLSIFRESRGLVSETSKSP